MSAAAEDEAALRTAQDHSPHVSRTSLDEQKGSTEQSKEGRRSTEKSPITVTGTLLDYCNLKKFGLR